ncbi:hypothetical protein CBR_g68785 [Chara braunii]|uniref:DUF4360 domain-containing protein n=1 Tax=Chara braunii TaxID=69332 RepID=A0A388K9U8_CHABU|nr:hypothetical protein CBR_g68785 [Chara braunii]|eukprot:GBG66799.1 hypothetical protein CBR_g68785 [Chara braunii]
MMEQKAIRSISSVRTMAMAVVVLLAILLNMAAHGEAQRVPRGVSVGGVSAFGSGCSSATARLIGRGKSVSVSVNSFEATTTGGLAKQRNVCTLSLSLSYPSGWQVSVSSVKASGSAKLSRGVRGIAQASYYISGSPGTATASLNINGAYNRGFTLAKKLRPSIFVTCGQPRTINVKLEVRVNPGGARRASGVVKIGGSPAIFGLTWKRC